MLRSFAVDLVDAMRNPIDDQCLRAGIPERARDFKVPGVDRFKLLGGRRRLHRDTQAGRVSALAVRHGQFQNIRSQRGEGGSGDQRFGIRKCDRTRSGFLAPDACRRGSCRRRRWGHLSRLSVGVDLSGPILDWRTAQYRGLAISGPSVQVGLAAQDGDAVHPGAADDGRIHFFGVAKANDRALHQGRKHDRRASRLSHGSKKRPAAQLGLL